MVPEWQPHNMYKVKIEKGKGRNSKKSQTFQVQSLTPTNLKLQTSCTSLSESQCSYLCVVWNNFLRWRAWSTQFFEKQSAIDRVMLAAITTCVQYVKWLQMIEVCFFLRDCVEMGVPSWWVAVLQAVIQRIRSLHFMAPPTSKLWRLCVHQRD